MKLHPRLQLFVGLAGEGAGLHPTARLYWCILFHNTTAFHADAEVSPGALWTHDKNLEPQQYFHRTNSD